MIWYNPLTWFRKSKQPTLFCDNLQCDEEIVGNLVAYSKLDREIYHNFMCARKTQVQKAFHSDKTLIYHINQLTRTKVLRLFKKGKLKQSKRLEENLGSA